MPDISLMPIGSLPDLVCRRSTVTLFAGPCSIESREQFDCVAEAIAAEGLAWIRGGAFKPRTNPHSFQGLGEEGLRIMVEAGKSYGLKTITEVMDSAHCPLVHSLCDGLQIGARNCQNFSLLQAVGRETAVSGKLVLYKRGFATTTSEWLSAVDYITGRGNGNVMLCERGLRTFEDATRFTLDVSAVPVVHRQSSLAVCADVSHAAGSRDLVPPLAYAALAAGADAIMVEIHPDPPNALSDSAQQLDLREFADLVANLRRLAAFFGKQLV